MTHPFPLFDSASEFRSKIPGPASMQASQRLTSIVNEYNVAGSNWVEPYLLIANDFLESHLHANGNANTFNRFRTEVERFTLWLTIKRQANPLELIDDDIFAYLEFLRDPDRQWVSAYNTKRVLKTGDILTVNPGWCPFWARTPKGTVSYQYDPKKTDAQNDEIRTLNDKCVVDNYRCKNTTIDAALRALSPFYKALIEEQEMSRSSDQQGGQMVLISANMNHVNPVTHAAKRFRRQAIATNIADDTGTPHCLTERQWNFTLQAANQMRLEDPYRWTRAWFLIAFLKANFLRVSDLCRSPSGTPTMSDISYVAQHEYWVFNIRRKGQLVRDVVLPDDMLTYLKTYRQSRGLPTALPTTVDKTPILAKLGRRIKCRNIETERSIQYEQSITIATASEEIDAVFQYAQKHIARQEVKHEESYTEDIEALKKASSSWLRHTGVSMALNQGTGLDSVRTGLGHVDPRTIHTSHTEQNMLKRVKAATARKV